MNRLVAVRAPAQVVGDVAEYRTAMNAGNTSDDLGTAYRPTGSSVTEVRL